MQRFIILLISAATVSWSGEQVLANFEVQEKSTYNESHDGMWNGHFDINGRGPFSFHALHIGNELIAYSPDARVSYKGTVHISGTLYHSDMEMYLLTNGGYFDSVTLEGQFVSPGKIEAHFLTHGAKDSGTLVLEQDRSLYEKGAQMRKISDRWIYYHGFTITKFSIDINGRIDGADTNGCGYEGEISIIAAKYNAYRTKLLLNSCYELDGVYHGMAYLLSSVAEDDTLTIQVYKEGQALYLPVVRDSKILPLHSEDPT